MDWLEVFTKPLNTPWARAVVGVVLLLLLAMVCNYVARMLLMRGFGRLRAVPDPGYMAVLLNKDVLRRAAQVVPAIVIHAGVRFVPDLSSSLTTAIENMAHALAVLCVARTIAKMLDVSLRLYEERVRQGGASRVRSIKAWVQLAKLMVALATVVVVIAVLVNKSPLIVISGFGALSAVLMLVFQDTIKSFVAGILIERNDLMAIGDWVEMPQADADGEVIDIALNTVKIQNWDKTIVTLPIWRLITDSFRNWRGMSESGGRRIKRALMIDAGSIRFLSDADIDRLSRVALISDYIHGKAEELRTTHQMYVRTLGEELANLPTNQRRLTNIGTFRAYALAYLRSHPGIHPGMTQMTRQLQPIAEGVPLELYCFTNTTAWEEYEAIQSDIFEHLMAILPEFGLREFQNPSDGAIRDVVKVLRKAPDEPKRLADSNGAAASPKSSTMRI